VKVVQVVVLEAVGPLTCGKAEVEHAKATEARACLRKKAEHAGMVYYGTAAADVGREVAWLLTKLSPVVLVEVLAVAVSSSLDLR
jgi:hypothetical protein